MGKQPPPHSQRLGALEEPLKAEAEEKSQSLHSLINDILTKHIKGVA